MSFRQTIARTLALFGPRQRRITLGSSRVHFEVRRLRANEMAWLAEAVTQQFQKLEQVEWAELDAQTRRVVVKVKEGGGDLARLEAALESAEHVAWCAASCFPERAEPHPGDTERLLSLSTELVADALALVIASALRLSPLPASRLAGTVASVLSVIKSNGWLRSGLDDRLGAERAELFMSLGIALGNGLSQRSIAALVDVVHKAVLLREARAHHRTWQAREGELYAAPAPPSHAELIELLRPVGLPDGPIEQYAERAWMVSLGGFALSFLMTRSLQRAMAALFGGVPKPARLGRDVFSAGLSHHLAERQVLVMKPEALRRLDRVDCLVIAADVLPKDGFSILEVVVDGEFSADEAQQRILELFDVEHPLAVQAEGALELGPVGRVPCPPDQLTDVARRLHQQGALVLQLFFEGRRVALCTLELEQKTGLEELVSAAQRAELRVVVADDGRTVLDHVALDERIAPGHDACEWVQRRQAEGGVVAVVARTDPRVLCAADVGIGLAEPNQPPPFGAHLLCRNDLSDVRFLIEAVVAARRIARQSVNIALAAASMGAIVSAGGLVPMSSRRVITVVNAATLISMFNGLRAARALAHQPPHNLHTRTPYHALDAHGVMHRLGTSELGLSETEVLRRRTTAPPRRAAVLELAEMIADELWNPLAPLLAAGAGLSAVAGSLGDAGLVGAVVVLNALVGGVQRYRTERQIRRLTEHHEPTAIVHRDGKIRQVLASDLVAGDIVVLMSGDEVPADCRVLHAESLEVDMSSLTGESLPVARSARPSFEESLADRTSMLYAGSAIAAGRVTAVVVAAANQTEVARGTLALRRPPAQSGVEQRLRSLVDLTAPVALGAGVGLVAAGLVRGRRVEHLVPAGVSLAVAAVPEGLPLLSTAAQLAAARRLTEKHALVRNARSIESLGRVDVLCIDKTGTVTEGQIALLGVCDGEHFVPSEEFGPAEHHLITAAVRAAPDPKYRTARDDPTDLALARAADQHRVTVALEPPHFTRRAELPFEPERACHVVIGELSDQSRVLEIKGSPEALLPRVVRIMIDGEEHPFDAPRRQKLQALLDELAGRGLRLLAVGEKHLNPTDPDDPRIYSDLTLLGVAAFSDPVRPSARQALQALARAKVRVVMVTGDHPRTASAIAEQLGIIGPGQGVVTGAELLEMTDDALDARLDETAVFARVTPSQKARIVRALERIGHVVGMLGDGSNDAAAIRLAHVGIAVGEHSATAARGAADIVLTEARIETVLEAVVEGRAMWASVREAVSILVGGNLGEIVFTLGAGLIDGRPPLNPRQLLLVNLLTDVAPAMAIALRAPSAATLAELANEGPELSLAQPLNRQIATRAVVTSFGAGMAWTVARILGNSERASSVGLLALVGTQLGQTVVTGGFTRPVITTSLVSSAALAAIVQTPGLSQFFGCQPLSPISWGIALASSAAATGFGTAFPQLTQLLATKLGSFDAVLDQSPSAGSLPPTLKPSVPPSMRAVRSVIQNEGLLQLVDV